MNSLSQSKRREGVAACVMMTYAGIHLVNTMDNAGVGYVCPGCGLPVGHDQPHVDVREYTGESEVTLHMHDHSAGTRRRFHVEHFRRRIGDCMYELVGSPDVKG